MVPYFFSLPVAVWVLVSLRSSAVVVGLRRLRLFLAGRMPLALALPLRVVSFRFVGLHAASSFRFPVLRPLAAVLPATLTRGARRHFILFSAMACSSCFRDASTCTVISGIHPEREETHFRVSLLMPEDSIS